MPPSVRRARGGKDADTRPLSGKTKYEGGGIFVGSALAIHIELVRRTGVLRLSSRRRGRGAALVDADVSRIVPSRCAAFQIPVRPPATGGSSSSSHTPSKIEDAVVAPAVLAVADQQARRIGRERSFPVPDRPKKIATFSQSLTRSRSRASEQPSAAAVVSTVFEGSTS